jgi:hypothetical protein
VSPPSTDSKDSGNKVTQEGNWEDSVVGTKSKVAAPSTAPKKRKLDNTQTDSNKKAAVVSTSKAVKRKGVIADEDEEEWDEDEKAGADAKEQSGDDASDAVSRIRVFVDVCFDCVDSSIVDRSKTRRVDGQCSQEISTRLQSDCKAIAN